MNLLVNKVYDKAQIFETVQGEGVHSGVPSFFIRLQGCNVRCFFCDEKSTWKHGGEFAAEIDIDEILNFLNEKNPNLKRIVITGGEPTEQNLVPLIRALARKGFSVALETAATGEYLEDIFDLKNELGSEKLWITFSPKEIYSENGKPASERIWQGADELKFVFASEKAGKYLLEVIFKELDIIKSKMPVFLVPDWNNKEKYQEEILNILKIYPARCRIGIQAHKFWGLL
ncbi:MAG: 7-carboxy-7-deazaguanine synthase QueE [Candidatus Caenarcaniphilales bacterium]|nr:7-carboxy-7-deazaguanine synthase QueE [Candidatus Caenarcaniphilales bacterium]